MPTNTGEKILTGIIVLVVAIVSLILIVLGFFNWREYRLCSTQASPYCLQFGCVDPGSLCGTSAIRYTADGTGYYCSSAPNFLHTL